MMDCANMITARPQHAYKTLWWAIRTMINVIMTQRQIQVERGGRVGEADPPKSGKSQTRLKHHGPFGSRKFEASTVVDSHEDPLVSRPVPQHKSPHRHELSPVPSTVRTWLAVQVAMTQGDPSQTEQLQSFSAKPPSPSSGPLHHARHTCFFDNQPLKMTMSQES